MIPQLTPIEQFLRHAILGAEQRALDQDSYVTSAKVGSVWEKLWWPYGARQGLSPTSIEDISVKSSRKIASYCSFDISGPGFETIGIDVKSEMSIGNCILAVEADLIKIPLFEETDTVTIIDFKRKYLSRVEAANDLGILANAYAFKGLGRPITYIVVDISESNEEVKTSACFLDLETIEHVGRTLNYLAEGIYKGIDYQCTWLCKECNKCSFKS